MEKTEKLTIKDIIGNTISAGALSFSSIGTTMFFVMPAAGLPIMSIGLGLGLSSLLFPDNFFSPVVKYFTNPAMISTVPIITFLIPLIVPTMSIITYFASILGFCILGALIFFAYQLLLSLIDKD